MGEAPRSARGSSKKKSLEMTWTAGQAVSGIGTIDGKQCAAYDAGAKFGPGFEKLTLDNFYLKRVQTAALNRVYTYYTLYKYDPETGYLYMTLEKIFEAYGVGYLDGITVECRW